MTLTPEQWRELRDGRIDYQLGTLSAQEFIDMVTDDWDALIDAARPGMPDVSGPTHLVGACWLCDEDDPHGDDECTGKAKHCQRCLDHPGWAA